MGTKPLVVTGQHELADQLVHPSYEAIWDRAVEIFGDLRLARDWMNTPLPVLDGNSPETYAKSGETAKQREVLNILIRIEYGLFD